MKSGGAPEAPNPEVSIPLQGSENRKTFDYQLGQMRTGTSGPTGTTSWSKTPVFDEAAYNNALADWNKGNSQGTWVPGTEATQGTGEAMTGASPGTPGHWEGATTTNTPQPGKDAFTTYNWTQNTTLSPEQQALYDTNTQSQLDQSKLLQGLGQNLSNTLSTPADFSSAGQINYGPGANSQGGQYLSGLADRSVGDNFSQAVSNAAYDKQKQYLDPQVAQQQQALEARLADQGFVPGTPGYQQAMQNFMDTNNRQYAAARDSAIGQGYSQGNAQLGLQSGIAGQLTGREFQGAQQNNSAVAQALQQLLLQRSQPINEINAIRGGTQVQVPSANGTSATPNMQAPDVLGQLNNQYQGQLGGYSADVGAQNATVGSIASVLAAYFM